MIATSLPYSDFFEQVTEFKPYPCQVTYAQTESDFVSLKLPTGVGKTFTVLVSWLHRQQKGKAPTRLVIIEPMRVLVTQVFQDVQKVISKSGLDISVHLLMGGSIDNDWITQPEKPCVIVGTQDQVLSLNILPYSITTANSLLMSVNSWDQVFQLPSNSLIGATH
jgi:CRISPR-associated endonuclease/helicase Cas3